MSEEALAPQDVLYVIFDASRARCTWDDFIKAATMTYYDALHDGVDDNLMIVFKDAVARRTWADVLHHTGDVQREQQWRLERLPDVEEFGQGQQQPFDACVTPTRLRAPDRIWTNNI